MGREPVSVNGDPVVSPVKLCTGDKIEVHLEGRTRIFYFHSNEDAVQVASRKPLSHLNAAASVKVTSPIKPIMSPSAKKNDNVEGDMPPPPPPQEKAVQEPAAPAQTVEEAEMPMVLETAAPDSEEIEQHDGEHVVALDKTEKLPVFEAAAEEEEEQLPQEMEEEEENDMPLIEATEKVEFLIEEEMINPEPMMMYTTEEEMFEDEEAKEENTAQLVSSIVSRAIAAALLASDNNNNNNTENASTDVELVENEAEPMDMTVIDEENENAEQQFKADHPALIQNEGCVPPSTSQKTKKSVRFTATATGTPEGAAYDATAALPFTLNTAGNDEEGVVVVVDDNTMAFAQWAGLATAGADEEMMSSPAEIKQATPASVAPDTLRKAKAQVAQFVSEAIAAATAAAVTPDSAPTSDGQRRTSSAPDTLIKAKAEVSRFVAKAIAAAVEAAATPASASAANHRQSAAAPDTLIKAKAQVSKFVSEAISAAVDAAPVSASAPDTLMKAKAEVSKFVSEAIAAATAGASPAPTSAAGAVGRRQSSAADTLIKAKAQVAHFVSEAIAAAVGGCATPQTGALAAKLTELKQEHDITFELPADFMRWTPGPATSKQLLSIAVAVNPHGEDKSKDAAAATTPKRMSLAPQQLAAKLSELEQEHDITFELPVDFMRWTPAPATAGKKSFAVGVTPRSAGAAAAVAVPAAAKAITPAKGMTPAGPGAQAPAPTPNTAITANKSAAAVARRKMSLDPTSLAAKLSKLAEEHDVDFELPADFMRWTPAAKRTVSIAVTPRAANAPASDAKSQRSVPCSAARAPAVTPAKAGMTPAGPGAQAPAPTPATAAKSIGKMMMADAGGLAVDTTALTTKLAALAEQHDITFELPADFMRWTPAPGNKTSGSVIIAPASAIKSQQRSAVRSRMAQAVGNADDDEDDNERGLPDEVEQPAVEKNDNDNNKFAGALAASLEAVASARKAIKTTTTPMSKTTPTAAVGGDASMSRRRSSIRTPGTKIAIIGRSTPRSAAPSSVKNTRRNSTAEKKHQQQPQQTADDVEMGEAEVAAFNGIAPADVVEKEVSGETLEKKNSPEAEVSHQAEEVEDAIEAEEDEEDEDFDFVEEQGAEEEAANLRRVAFVPLVDYRRAVVQVRIHRSRATGLATQLRGVSARALRLKRAATGLAKALEEERAKREELQATLQRIVANREAEEKEDIAEEDGMDCDSDDDIEEDAGAAGVVTSAVKVVVVGYNPVHQPCRTEMAGNVVVVRPVTDNKATTTTPAKSPMKANVGFAAGVVTAKTPSGNKTATKSRTPGTLKKSMRKTPAGGRVLDDVEVPSWVFETETSGAPAVDVTAELAEVAAAEEAEARDAEALEKLQAEVAAQAEAAESEEEEEEIDDEAAEEADRCHKCNEGDEGDVLLLCDGCDNACHLSCCNPPLKRVPKGDWFCVDCKKARKAEDAAARKASIAAAAAGGRGKKRAAPAAASESVEEKKPAPARGKKTATAAEKPAAAGTKRGRGAASSVAAAQEEKAPAAKRTRGGRQAATPASTEKAAPKRATRTKKK
jgi:PHD-finger